MQSVAPADIMARIRLENPWWAEGHSIGETQRRLKPRAYFRLFFPLLKTLVQRAIVLLGPRRVGKTVMIHHSIQALIDDGVAPNFICYFSVDHPLYNGLRLDQLLEYYARAAGIDLNHDAAYVFFDEIQYLKDWEKHLKVLVDSRRNLRCIASGSAAAALRLKSAESGAGRLTDFLLPPLTFYEYLDLIDKKDLIVTHGQEPATGEFFEASDIQLLNHQFLDYLNFGGYPEVVFSEIIRADPARFIKSDIIDKVLLRDLPSLYGIGDIQELNYLFTTLAFNTANEVSLGELSQNSGVAKNTIKKYIEYLEAAFLIKIVHRIDHNAKRFDRANFFKVYLTNPSMRAALFSPVLSEDEPALPFLIETAIFSQWFHGPRPETIHYARWADGEVDMVNLEPARGITWATEVKWSDRYCDRPQELKSLLSFCRANRLNEAVVTSRTSAASGHIDGTTIDFIPASVYCYTVGYKLIEGKSRIGVS